MLTKNYIWRDLSSAIDSVLITIIIIIKEVNNGV